MIKNWTDLWDGERYRVQTRDGREVRIFALDARRDDYPVVGEMWSPTCDRYVIGVWSLGGRCPSSNEGDDSSDLIPIPRKVKRWVNVYRQDNGGYKYMDHASEQNALALKDDQVCGCPFVATATVEWEE